ncbi:MAG: cytidyltransferase [Gammaproteobacteria bacterium]|nr:cytidyltransferase [Gammaproteobacteria bacterium]
MSANGRGWVAVTGRFQPFHYDHLELVLHALTLGKHLLIGITNPDSRSLQEQPASAHRHLDSSNPFTFFERAQMVGETLRDTGIPPDRYGIVPFPLDAPETWESYIPLHATQIVRVFSPWERDKGRQLTAAGYAVRLMDGDNSRRISASDIRHALRVGGSWRHLVPAGSRAVLDALGETELQRRCSPVPLASAS